MVSVTFTHAEALKQKQSRSDASNTRNRTKRLIVDAIARIT